MSNFHYIKTSYESNGFDFCEITEIEIMFKYTPSTDFKAEHVEYICHRIIDGPEIPTDNWAEDWFYSNQTEVIKSVKFT